MRIKLISLALVVFLFFSFKLYKVLTPSMSDKILPGDYVLSYQLTLFPKISTSSVLAFKNNIPNDNSTYIKRVIASPNDTIFFKRDFLLVNESKIPHDIIFEMMIEESEYPDSTNYFSAKVYSEYLLSRSGEIENYEKYILDKEQALIVPEGHYFMVGDNYYESMDSRFWGFIPKMNIKGRVVWIF
ncbi:MAG: signal peptidase I [Balneolaceae bacterium]